MLARYEDNNANYRKLAETAMRYLATPEIARKRGAGVRIVTVTPGFAVPSARQTRGERSCGVFKNGARQQSRRCGRLCRGVHKAVQFSDGILYYI